MGETYHFINFLPPLSISDWVNVFGVVVNAGLAFWIGKTIQNNLNNKRVLKDHFIAEVKDLRNEYKKCLSNLHRETILPHSILPLFKLMNIKVNDIMLILCSKYKIEVSTLLPYQTFLPELITESRDFIDQYKNNRPFKLSQETKIALIKFQQENNQLFNKIIIKINDA